MFGLLDRLSRPLLKVLDPEDAHGLAIKALRLLPPLSRPAADAPELAVRAFGLQFPNPVGIAAGFDKNAMATDALLRIGFGFVEVGTVTPLPQAGNPRPRLFRLAADEGVVNRLGFNNHGAAAVLKRLNDRRGAGGIVGVNVGANKDSADRTADYVRLIEIFAGVASYFTVNVSSPNTPGLRNLQGRAALDDLLGRLAEARGAEPLFLKIAPDLTEADVAMIVEACLAHGVDGLIVSNTTLDRPDSLRSVHAGESGGLSGAPLKDKALTALRWAHGASQGRLALIGVGGIASGADAYACIRAGASAVQVYSALIYEGPGLIMRIRRDLADRLRAEGFGSVAEAVGAR